MPWFVKAGKRHPTATIELNALTVSISATAQWYNNRSCRVGRAQYQPDSNAIRLTAYHPTKWNTNIGSNGTTYSPKCTIRRQG
jgi:hypothetical protein